MRKIIVQKPAQLFISILLPFLLATIFIILTLSSVLYVNFEKIITDMIKRNAISNLESISNSASIMKQTTKSLAVNAFFDDKIVNMLYGDIELYDYGSHIKKLDSYKNIYPFLHSIYVYNGHNFYVSPSSKFLYGKEIFFDKDMINILKDMQKYKSNSFISRKIPNTADNSINTNDTFSYVYTYLFYDSQQNSGKISEAIILNISESLMYDYIKQFDRNNQTLYVIDNKGNLMLSNSKHPMLKDLSNKEFIKKVMASTENIESMRIDVDNEDSYITYVSEDSLDWKFISVSPYSIIVLQINNMRKLTYLIAGLILLIGVLMSLFISRRIYIPMKLNAVKLDKLELEMKSNFYSKKQEFLNKLIKNSTSEFDDLSKISSDMKQYNILFDLTKQLLVVVCKIDRYSNFCEDYNLSDRNLMKFGVMNIISELFCQHFECECVDIGNDHILVLLNYSDVVKPWEQEMFMSRLAESQKCVDEYINISVSFSFIGSFSETNLLNSYINRSIELIFHKYLIGHKCIVYPQILNLPTNREYSHPLDLEKRMGSELMQGHISEAEEILVKILKRGSAYGKSLFNMSVLHILISLDDAAKTICKNANTENNFNCSKYISLLEKAEILEDTLCIFRNAFNEINTVIEQIKESKNDRFGDAVIKIISTHYMDSDLSVNRISEMLDISPAYLGRLFRNHTSVPITDYINKLRIEKAKELLLLTDQSIATVMENTGFISRSHFYNTFKSEYGVTPSQIRQFKIEDI